MRQMNAEKYITRTSYESISVWDSYKVRNFCIKNEFYTRGDVEDYTKMLHYVDEHHHPEMLDIERVAFDILDHSSQEANDEYCISDIMFLLTGDCITTYYGKTVKTEAEVARA